MKDPGAHLLRLQRDDPARSGGGRRRRFRDSGSLRQRVERAFLRAAGQGRRGQRAFGARLAPWRRSVRDRVHLRRHRVGQLRDSRRRRRARAGQAAPSHRERDRARGGVEHAEGAGAARMAHHAPAARGVGHRVARPAARGDDRRHGARLGHARQQRDRHDSARGGAGRHRARARCPDAHRRGAVSRQDPGGRARAWRGPALALRAQVQRPEGCRRAVDQARHPPPALSDRRQARAQPPCRHRERAGARRPGRRGDARVGEDERRGRTRRRAARSAGGRRAAVRYRARP